MQAQGNYGWSDTKHAADDSLAWRPQARFTHVVGSGDQLEYLNDSGGIAVSFASLPKTPVHIAFEGSQSDSLSVWTTRTDTGFRSLPKIAADLITIRFVNSGTMSRNGSGGNDILVRFDQALCTSFQEMRHEQASPGFSALTATVSCDSVVKACQALSGSGSTILPRFNAIVDLRMVGLLALRQTVAALQRQSKAQGHDGDLMTPLLQDLLVYQLVSVWPTAGAPIGSVTETADRPVRLAVDYIEANLRRRLEIAEIAAAAGVSVRALQIAFRRRVGHTPVQYLIARRLDRVHTALQSPEGRTIRQIALEWGFAHMSDFSRRYRERFGHLPSKPNAG